LANAISGGRAPRPASQLEHSFGIDRHTLKRGHWAHILAARGGVAAKGSFPTPFAPEREKAFFFLCYFFCPAPKRTIGFALRRIEALQNT
jgi:hypothetical protein